MAPRSWVHALPYKCQTCLRHREQLPHLPPGSLRGWLCEPSLIAERRVFRPIRLRLSQGCFPQQTTQLCQTATHRWRQSNVLHSVLGWHRTHPSLSHAQTPAESACATATHHWCLSAALQQLQQHKSPCRRKPRLLLHILRFHQSRFVSVNTSGIIGVSRRAREAHRS